jgi:molybdopterin synthase sulfur carrier subunit
MPTKVRIPTPLRKLTNNEEMVEVSAGTVGGAITELQSRYPGIKERLVDENGAVRRFVNVYVNEEDIRFLQNQQTPLKDGDEASASFRRAMMKVNAGESAQWSQQKSGLMGYLLDDLLHLIGIGTGASVAFDRRKAARLELRAKYCIVLRDRISPLKTPKLISKKLRRMVRCQSFRGLVWFRLIMHSRDLACLSS